jgi:DNA-binding NtrC family response regulator
MSRSRSIRAEEFLSSAEAPAGALEGNELERAYWTHRGLVLDHARERAFSASMTRTLAKTCEELGRTSTELARLDRAHERAEAPPLASSTAMNHVLELARAVAQRATTVLLVGDTGSGKGRVARYLHQQSSRARRSFVELNCAGLHRELTESELFGHERGAFTGAGARKLGLFEAANGGTLFLDEIGELDAGVQAKLLKVVEDRRFRRIGGVDEIEVDVRLVTATHRDLDVDAAEGRFRSDLLYRLNVFTIRVPRLAERRDDIVPLARHFLSLYAGSRANLSPEAEALLVAYDWPGNVRELRNVLERAAILCPHGGEVGAAQLPPLGPRSNGASDAPLEMAERRVVQRTLEASGGNIVAAARHLGVSRGTLYRKIQKYGLAVPGGGRRGGGA